MELRPAIKFIKENLKGELIGVEVGVQKGNHAMEIFNSLNLEKLYLIDIWRPYIQEKRELNFANDYENVLQKFNGKENVIIMRQDSIEASKQFEENSLDFVYIDDCHQYEFVKKDIEAWLPKVKKGGILSGHDYATKWLGVTKAVDELRAEYILNTSKGHCPVADWWIEK